MNDDRSDQTWNSIEFVFLAVAITVRCALAVFLLERGFIALSADDFARQLYGYAWFEKPFIFSSGLWPPLQFWILGLATKVIGSVHNANLLINGLFSSALIIVYYLLIRIHFTRKIAFISLLVFATLPWQIRLSLSGLSEPIYHFFLIAALWLLFTWEKKCSPWAALGCSIALLAANVTRVDAWIFYLSVLFYIFIIKPFVTRTWKAGMLRPSILLFFIPLAFIILWMSLGKVGVGYAGYASGLSRVSSGAAGIMVRLGRYPVYLFLVSPLITVLGMFALFKYLRIRGGSIVNYILVPAIYFAGLIGLSLITGSDATAAPLRIVVPFVYLMIPMVLALITDGFGRGRWIVPAGVIILLTWNIIFTSVVNPNDFRDARNVASLLKRSWSEHLLKDDQHVFFEPGSLARMKYDMLAMKVLSDHPKNIYVLDETLRDNMIVNARKTLVEEKIGALVLSSKVMKEVYSMKDISFTDAGAYRIIWGFPEGRIFPSLPRDEWSVMETPHVEIIEGIELIAYHLQYGELPLGVSTFWKVHDWRGENITIEYGIRSDNDNSDSQISIVGFHLLGFRRDLSEIGREMELEDWQGLLGDNTSRMGRYVLFIRLRWEEGGEKKYGEWHQLTKVKLVGRMRDAVKLLFLRNKGDIQTAYQVIRLIL